MRSADGADFQVDLKPIIREHPTLEPLSDPTVFATARVGEWGRSVIWAHDDRLEVAAENLRAWAIEQEGHTRMSAFGTGWRGMI